MADNYVGVGGEVFASDKIAAGGIDINYPRMKLVTGGDGTATEISSTNPLFVSPSGGGASVQVALTVTNGAYTAADVAGGLITFANAVRAVGKHSVIYSVKLYGVAALEYDLWLFNADIATPALDNAAFALAAADGAKFLGSIPIIAADYVAAQSAFNAATVKGIGLKVKAAAAATSIYGYLVARATTTPGTTALVLTVDFEYMD